MKKILILVGSLILAACHDRREKTRPGMEKITESVYASGIVKSRDQYEVFPATAGLISVVLVTEGDIVRAGDPILHITNTSARLNMENAGIAAGYNSVAANKEKLNELKINIDLAKLKMDNDRSLFQRQQNLWSQQIGTRNELELRELNWQSSVNDWEAARLKYTDLEKQLSFLAQQAKKNLELTQSATHDYTVLSKTSGKVYSVLKKRGEMASTTSPVAIVGNARDFYLELQVDEYDIARIRVGQKIFLTMDSYKGEVFGAIVSKINPLMNSHSKTFTVEANLTRQPPALYPNLTCEANIVIREKEKALTIPRSYLLEGDSVILENKKKKWLLTGLKDYEKVEILDGLHMNDIIYKPAP